MVDEVIKALVSLTIEGVTINARPPTLTLKDSSVEPINIKYVGFSSIEPMLNISGYGLDPVSTVGSGEDAIYLVVITDNIPADYDMTVRVDNASVLEDGDLVGFSPNTNYKLNLHNGMNGETVGWMAFGLAKSVDVTTPKTHNLVISKDYGGYSTQIEGLYVKPPISIYKLFTEQVGGVIGKGDIFNITIDKDVAIIGDERGSGFDEEIAISDINLNFQADFSAMLNVSDYFNVINNVFWKLNLSHSDLEHRKISSYYRVDLKNKYGKIRLHKFIMHVNSHSIVIRIYNPDHTLSSTQAWSTSAAADIIVTKGQYVELEINMVPGGIDSKNDSFFNIYAMSHNANINPALLISGMFDETHTFNITNNGYIIGHGGSSDNRAHQANYSDLWQTKPILQVPDLYPRRWGGGDAIVAADVKQVNIINYGTISGGGPASKYTWTTSGSTMYYTAGNGGAPKGRGGVSWARFNAGGGNTGGFVYGNDASVRTPVGGGNWGKRVTTNYGWYPGFSYRGCTNVSLDGPGEYLGTSSLSLTVPTV